MSQNQHIEKSEIDLHELFAVLWAHKVFITLVTGLCLLFAGYYALNSEKKFSAIDSHLAPNKYNFDLLLKALKMNPNKKIDIVIEQWKNTASLQNSYYKLKDFLLKNQI